MKTTIENRQIKDGQRDVERSFRQNGPFYHVSSKPLETSIIFGDEEEKKTALTLLAITCAELDAEVLAYALMSNHFHLLLRNRDPLLFYNSFVGKLESFLVRHGHPGIKLPFDPTVVKVESLRQFRNVVAYIIRNEYVVNPKVNPLSSIWCSGYLYFNSFIDAFHYLYKSPDKLSIDARRILTKTRNLALPANVKIWNNSVAPSSFVNFKLVEHLYGNTWCFFRHVFKDVEAQIETAIALGETPLTPDEEMIRTVYSICMQNWGMAVSELSSSQKMELMKIMKYDYKCSNAQISRIAGIKPSEVDRFFPMSAKAK